MNYFISKNIEALHNKEGQFPPWVGSFLLKKCPFLGFFLWELDVLPLSLIFPSRSAPMKTNLRSKCSRSCRTDAWKDGAEKHTGILDIHINQHVQAVAREYRGSAGAHIFMSILMWLLLLAGACLTAEADGISPTSCLVQESLDGPERFITFDELLIRSAYSQHFDLKRSSPQQPSCFPFAAHSIRCFLR